MVRLKSLSALLGAAATLLLGTAARECYVDEGRGDNGGTHWVSVGNHQQLNRFEGCTTLIGSIDIANTFTGPFSLRGVRNITGTLSAYGAVDEIDLPDLEYIRGVILFERYRVNRLLLPRVKQTKGIFLSQPRGFFFDLSALGTAWVISLDGPWPKVSFPSLENVDFTLSFETQRSWDHTGYRDPAPVHIEFPVLRRVRELRLEGDIKSLSIPNLEEIGEGGLIVKAQQADLPAVDMLSLRTLQTRLSLWGGISRIDLGPLRETNASMYINTIVPVEVHSDLYHAGDISIYGELKTLNLTSLLHADSMTIGTNIRAVECSEHAVWTYRYLHRPREAKFCNKRSLIRAGRNPWPDILKPTPTGFEPSPTPTPTSDFSHTTPTVVPSTSPSPSPHPGVVPRPGLGYAADIVIVTAFGILLLLSIAWYWTNRRRKVDCEEEEGEKEECQRGRGPPPISKAQMEIAREKGEAERLLQGEIEVESEDEGVDAPPPYAKHVRG
ncbi:hypothetical protein BJY01DRAFT_253917 [Aspergillus pseudoustus]|uniref:Uncharacterized protein n=1 Tax=Aspergillus pseudoustus TaxID=1810923 RepID=A0ABR4IX18_9EURO